MNKKCDESGCDNAYLAKGKCRKHYMQQLRSNTVSCDEDGCSRSVYSMGLCESHYKKDLRKRNPDYDTAQRAVMDEYKASIDPQYHNAHNLVRYHRGSASDYQCIDCGSQGQSWSLSKFDNIEYGNSLNRTLPFSRNVDDYESRCYQCHGRFDKISRDLGLLS